MEEAVPTTVGLASLQFTARQHASTHPSRAGTNFRGGVRIFQGDIRRRREMFFDREVPVLADDKNFDETHKFSTANQTTTQVAWSVVEIRTLSLVPRIIDVYTSLRPASLPVSLLPVSPPAS
eukprot:761776-Hanusia_phi.AAC.8